MTKPPKTPDLLLVVSAMTVSILTGLLFMPAAGDPQMRLAAPMFIVGLVGSGLILFRQLRKARESLIASEARARYVAHHDSGTQLPNRLLLLERIADAIKAAEAGAEPVGVLFCISLGRLKDILEGFGDAVGDQVLSEVTERLRAVCGDGDTVARLSEDEFVILWRQMRPNKAMPLALKAKALLSGPMETSQGPLLIVSTVGISLIEADSASPSEVLRRARLALSHAKRTGAPARFFASDMDHDLRDRSEMEAELHAALRLGQIRMVYQPQCNGRGAMTGAEALMRWTSPTRGEVPPAVFIPLAESCGLSEQLGAFALKQSFTDAKRWPGLKIAINVSVQQIRSVRMIETLKSLLDATGANPSQFELEITEGVLLQDTPEVFRTLAAIRRLGFKIALDDFGTGYSSLSYLRRFPIDKIKIDRSFIVNLGVRPECEAIVRAIMNMAAALDLKVVAEGVETQAQMDRLNVVGCHQIQGYLFSRPIEAGDISRFMAGASHKSKMSMAA